MNERPDEGIHWPPIQPRATRRATARASARAGAARAGATGGADDLARRKEVHAAVTRLLARHLPLLRRRANAVGKGNFVRATVGLRTHGKQRPESFADELVVKVTVARKLALKTVRARGGLIPPVIRGRVKIGGRFVELAVGTDV